MKGLKKLGVRLGNWLSANEARALWQFPDVETLKGKRDRAIIAVLLGCGLRRRELSDLSVEDCRPYVRVTLICFRFAGEGSGFQVVPMPGKTLSYFYEDYDLF